MNISKLNQSNNSAFAQKLKFEIDSKYKNLLREVANRNSSISQSMVERKRNSNLLSAFSSVAAGNVLEEV